MSPKRSLSPNDDGSECSTSPSENLSWKVRSARDRTIRTFHIRVRSTLCQNSGLFARIRQKSKKFRNFQHFLQYLAWGSVWKEWYENGNMGTENSKKLKCCREKIWRKLEVSRARCPSELCCSLAFRELLFFRCRGTPCPFCLRRHFLYIGINGTYRFRLRWAPFSGLFWPFFAISYFVVALIIIINRRNSEKFSSKSARNLTKDVEK